MSLDALKIAALTEGRYHIKTVAQTDSTNNQLRQEAIEGAPEGTALFAAHQTAGRGRMGRSFFSPEGSGLYFSVLLRPQGVASGMKITAAAGVAVAEAVRDVLGLELSIKWVNDLYYKNRKVCGILAESATDGQGGFAWCVLGIGLNVFAPEGGFGELSSIAGALLDQRQEGILERLAAAILDRFFAWYDKLEEPSLMEAYRSRSFLQGRTVTACRGEQRLRGTVAGIDEDGALLLQIGEDLIPLQSGEVQLEDYR